MVKTKILNKTEYHLWNEFINKLTFVNVFQTIQYYEALKILKWGYEIFVLIENDTIVGGSIIQIKRILNKNISVINYGPLVIEPKYYDICLEELISYTRRKSIYLDLNLLSDYSLNKFENKLIGQNNTFIIDLKQDIDGIFNHFSKTNRNCCRKAEKEGVKVIFSQEKKDIDSFIMMYKKMANRKGLDMINISFLEQIIYNLLRNNLGFVAIAKYNDIIYNMAIVGCTSKVARYLFGASIISEKNIPPIGQTLHYEIIKKLKADGFAIYDLGGVPSETLEESHPNYGVWKFKKGFGGEYKVLTNNYRIYYNKLFKLLFRK